MNACRDFTLRLMSRCQIVAAFALGTACFFVLRMDAAESPPPSPAPVASTASASGDFEVLLHGPVHEAFMERFQLEPQAGVLVDQQPPEPIQEISPDVRPEGNVIWVPGYFGWDVGEEEFIWISGTWRVPPPGHRWVPGYWSREGDGFRWTSGFWVREGVDQLVYLPPPPDTQERGPSQSPPSDDSFWIPGCWKYQDDQYAWQPGYWATGRENWVWIPSRYVHTPRGSVFVEGHWDNRLESRGLLFAPIKVRGDAETRAALQLTPQHVLDLAALSQHLFVHANTGQYLFGNYYGDAYVDLGIQPWHVYSTARRVYDPLFTHARFLALRAGNDLLADLSQTHATLLDTLDLQPARTLVDQTTRLANLPDGVDAAQVTLAHSLAALTDTSGDAAATALGAVGNLAKVTDQQQAALDTAIQQVISLRTNRVQVEGQAAGSVSGDVAAGDTTSVLQLPEPAQVPGVTDVPVVRPVPQTLERVIEGTPVPRVPRLPIPKKSLPLPDLPF